MYDLLGPVLIAGFFFSINLMSVHNFAKFQHCGVIFAKSAVDTKNRLFFRFRALFLQTLYMYVAHNLFLGALSFRRP
jgi:hypothetical protein